MAAMATRYQAAARPMRLHGSLGDAHLTIGSPRFDAVLLWGCPLAATVFVWLWLAGASLLPEPARNSAVAFLALGVRCSTPIGGD